MIHLTQHKYIGEVLKINIFLSVKYNLLMGNNWRVKKMVLIKERIGKMLEYVKEQIYPENMPIRKYRMIKTDQRFEDVSNLDTSDWEEFTNT